MNFKVGDKVRRNQISVDEGKYCEFCAPNGVPAICEIVEIIDEDNVNVKCPNGTTEYMSPNTIELVKPHKPKSPTHVVIWDEEDKDPHKFFTDEKEAKEFMKELSEKSNVRKDSIILIEIKSAQKVNITKNVRLMNYKI